MKTKILIGLLAVLLIGLMAVGASFFLKQSSNKDVSQEVFMGVDETAEESDMSQNNVANDQEAEAAIALQYESFVKSSPGVFSFKSFSHNDIKVSLTIAERALNFDINNDIQNYLDTVNWGIYSCLSPSKSPAYVLSLNNRVLYDYAGDIYPDTIKRMETWESNLLENTGSVLFPRPHYDTESLRSGEYQIVDLDFGVKESVVSNDEGEVGSIAYAIFGDHLLIGNNRQCLIEIGNSLVELVI